MSDMHWNVEKVKDSIIAITGLVLAFLLLSNQQHYNSIEKRPYFKIELFEENKKIPNVLFDPKFPREFVGDSEEFRLSIRLRIKNVGLLPGYMDNFGELNLAVSKGENPPFILEMSNVPSGVMVIYPGEDPDATLTFATNAEDSKKFAELMEIFKEIGDKENPSVNIKLSSKVRYYALNDSAKRNEFFVTREDFYMPRKGFVTRYFQAN